MKIIGQNFSETFAMSDFQVEIFLNFLFPRIISRGVHEKTAYWPTKKFRDNNSSDNSSEIKFQKEIRRKSESGVVKFPTLYAKLPKMH